jgi:hypothetical protein
LLPGGSCAADFMHTRPHSDEYARGRKPVQLPRIQWGAARLSLRIDKVKLSKYRQSRRSNRQSGRPGVFSLVVVASPPPSPDASDRDWPRSLQTGADLRLHLAWPKLRFRQRGPRLIKEGLAGGVRRGLDVDQSGRGTVSLDQVRTREANHAQEHIAILPVDRGGAVGGAESEPCASCGLFLSVVRRLYGGRWPCRQPLLLLYELSAMHGDDFGARRVLRPQPLLPAQLRAASAMTGGGRLGDGWG